MRATLVRHAFPAAIAVGLAAATAAQEPARPPDPSTAQFRAGIDLTRVDVTVLDKHTRKPVTGLTAADFAVTVDGDAQRLATLAEVHAPVATGAAARFVEAARDVASNAEARRRLFVIVMNDAAGGNDPYDRQTGIRIAERLIDGLGPEDQASVVFTRDNRHAQDFTADRMLLRRAVRRFRPMRSGGVSPFGVLQRAQRFLADMPGYRRALVLISPVATDPDAGTGQEFGIKDSTESASRELAAVSSSARISHVPIYLFSTHGLHAPTAQDLRWGGGVNGAYEIHVETFRTIAGLTGGRAIAANNAPTELVPAVLDELASYYALAYESSYPADGRRRWLQIDVARRDVMVMPSRVLITAARPRTEPAHHRLLDSARDSGLVEAIGAPLPAGDVPLRLASAPFAVPSKREQAVALTLALPSPALGVEDYRIRLMLFDAEGRRELLTETHDVHVSGSTAKESQKWLEVALRLDLRPGRYNLRVAAEPRSSRTSGSVRATLIVPDFANDPISLSGVAIGRAESDTIAGREKVSGLLPFAPTAVRAFAVSDRVGALLRVHQPARRPAQPVTLMTEIVDGTGALVQASSRTISADAFVDGAGVEHRVELPRGSLPAGSYLLRFVASAGPSRAQRDVRFEIVPNPASRIPNPASRSPITPTVREALK